MGSIWRDWELYDLSKDRCEQVNLAGLQQERVKQMMAQWTEIDEGFTKQRESAPPTAKRFMAARGAAQAGAPKK